MTMEQTEGSRQQEYIFALDIGTRSVIGIVGTMQRGLFHVADMEYAEHDKRAMFDGQIEDIDQVARVSGIIKDRLEARLGITLDNVCVAAAGRALRTCRSEFELELNPEEPVSNQMLYQLEMGAIGISQDEVNAAASDGEEPGLFCVGYSVVGYYLDDYRMTTILGHKGRRARVDVIATFLPNQVVDSLRSAMGLIDLNIINLTLEPIAAMNAVIPSELRLLNLALVDIGAGTSDIAVSDSGSVISYTMATIAGDEITEALMKRYLIDFTSAEKLKADAGAEVETLGYTDILGFEYTISRGELLEALKGPVETLAKEICARITESNGGKPPVAVFLVGGGSKAPMLVEAVSAILDIDVKKVAVGGSSFMKKQIGGNFELADPEYATPLGIALTAAAYAEQNSMYVYVNDHKVYMLRSSGFTVMNALLMCGYKYPQLMGKSGRSVSFTLNGENVMMRGGLPRPAEITVNDRPASIATGLACSDRIIIMPSLSGADAAPRVSGFIKTSDEPEVTVDGIPYVFGELALINGNQVRHDHAIEQNDVVNTVWVNSLGQLCKHTGIVTEGRHFLINDVPAKLTDLLRSGDVITSEDDSYEFHAVTGPVQLEDVVLLTEPEPVCEPEPEPIYVAEPEPKPVTEEKRGPSMVVTLNRRNVELYPKEDKQPYLFLDMLNMVDIDPTKPQGDIILRVNGKNASYLQEIHQGDDIQIYWSQQEDMLEL